MPAAPTSRSPAAARSPRIRCASSVSGRLFDRAAFPEGPSSRHLALLKVVAEKAEYWDAPNSRTVRLLALAASAVAGAPIGQADHDVLTDLSAPLPVGAVAAR